MCASGTDCTDCGPRTGLAPSPSPSSSPSSSPTTTITAGVGCYDTCTVAADGDCDDGGAGAEFSMCVSGTDCTDCGPRSRRALADLLERKLVKSSEPPEASAASAAGAAGAAGASSATGAAVEHEGVWCAAEAQRCDCALDCLAPLKCACSEARACCDITEPFKTEPAAAGLYVGDGRQLQVSGCTSVSPSPPSPSPLPTPPPPSLPPLPPFPPISSGEAIEQRAVVSVSTEITLDGALEDVDQAAVVAGVRQLTGCLGTGSLRVGGPASAPLCVLTVTFAAGSVVVSVEATTPASEATAVSDVSSSFDALVTADTAAIGDAIGVRVLGVSPVVTAARTLAVVVAAVSPPPPVAAAASASEDSSMGVIAGAAAGGVLVLLVCVYLARKQSGPPVKVVPHAGEVPC